MIDDAFHASSLAWRHGHLVPLLDPTFQQAAWTGEAARALDDVPDAVLKDLGLTRSEALFAAVPFSGANDAAPRLRGDLNLLRTAAHDLFLKAFSVVKALARDLTTGRPHIAQRAKVGGVHVNSRRRS